MTRQQAIKQAIRKIEDDGISEIIVKAIEEYVDGFNSIVHYDCENDTYSAETWTSGTHLNPDSRLIEVFRINGNWISNNNWEINDILDDDEYEQLRGAVQKKEQPDSEEDLDYMVDFLNKDQLSLINIDLNERLEQYLLFDDTLSQHILEQLEMTL